ncbi:arachidonate 5-lipoxygenase-activating protein isoform X3 [Peromyscus leucopus]|uniref:arachidonate 5-lipoxygenase-activating protein isoform X3 n=1 Tax=Peromyscus leucopus TaxID=10041 RepID=UPI00188508F9|nr:arachidonate 5-lipoxygenase-activating protein isoform X3 [Peromyscus leucopus]
MLCSWSLSPSSAWSRTPELRRCIPHFPCGTLDCRTTLQPSSCCLRGTDVFACEAEVLRGLSGRENSEHPWLHIRQADHLVPVPHVPRRSTQPLPHLLLRKRLRELHKNCNHNHLASASHPLIAGCRGWGQSPDQ